MSEFKDDDTSQNLCYECKNCFRQFNRIAQYAQHVRICVDNKNERKLNCVQKIQYEIPFLYTSNSKLKKNKWD